MPIVARQRVHFGPFELDVHAGELFKHGLKLKLQGHPIQILAMLLERPGELITREEIQQKLWPSESETFVDFEHGLNTAVRKLRQALGDEAETPQYIETLPRRGYRFVGSIAAREGLHTPFIPPVSAGSLTDAVATREAGVSGASTHAGSAEATSATAMEGRATRRTLSYRPLLVLVLLPVALLIAVYVARYMRSELGTLVVTGTRQLTQNGKLGLVTGTSARYGAIQTDGRRVYFTVIGDNPLRFVSVNGGEETVLPSPVPNPRILHISPDGSTLIVRDTVGKEGKELAPVWLVQANGGSARKLGDVEVQDAAFAPDGKTIILAIEKALYLTDLSGTNPVKIADIDGRPFWLRWSPDGAVLRFSVLEAKRPESSIWQLDRQGKLRQVLADWKGLGKTRPRICCGVWSKDGKYFLFRSNRQYWAMREGVQFGQVEPVLLTTGGQRVVEATASPLSNTLFVNENLETTHSLKLDLKTKQMAAVYPELKPSFIEYSADGEWVAYGNTSEEWWQLWRARKDGSDRRQLTTTPMWVYMFRFSPDGRKIAVMANTPAGQWKIYWVSVDGGDLHGIPSPPESHCDPNWSPDGESILFGQTPETWAEPGAPRHIYVYNLRTGKTVEVEGSTGLFSPRWSPDGRYVVAMRIDFQGMSLLDRTTGKWRVLTQQPTDEPFWSPDSTWIYFNDFDDTTVWRVSARTSKLERVMTTPRPPGYSLCNARSFAPDGNMMLNCRHTQGDVFALDYR